MSDSDFDIDNKRITNSPKRNRYHNVWTSNDQFEKLNGYLEIDPTLWSSIKCGSHIRYITKENEYRPGGFVLKNPFKYKGESSTLTPSIEISDNEYGKVGFRLQNFFNKNSPDYTTWIVDYDNIMKVYLKVDAPIRAVISSLEQTIESVNTNMKKITTYIKKMDERIKKIELKK